MSLKPVLPCLLLAVLSGACASTAKAERPEGPPPRVLLQSPLALLLEHHDELLLSTDQMIALGQREEALQARNRPLREKLREEPPPLPERPPPGEGSEMGRVPAGGVGGWDGTRPGWGGGMSGPPLPSGGVPRERPQESEEARARRTQQAQSVLHELEANEAAAYEDAEKLLDDKQKTQARELLSQLREARKRVREAMQGPAPEL